MPKRRYTHIDKLGKEIEQMIKAGNTQREIALFFGLKDKTVVHQYLKRQRKREKQLIAGIFPKRCGRRHKGYTLSEEDKDQEIRRLKMEVELLRSSPHQIGGRR
ncbi:MAG: putative transposase [Firmicutes bacterium]|nr:putative transposase [Bacillota bacterium]